METALADNLKLMEALDNLNARYVRGSVKVSTQGAYSSKQIKQDRKSPNYSTSWDDVPFV
jgi:DNA polymerase V